MASIAQYQVHLMLLLFAVGAIGTLFLFRKPPGHTAWKLADLVWVLLGGVGALIAIIAGLYTTDSSRLDRQIDVAYAVTRAFDGDAARFRLRYCEGATDPNLLILCEKIELLSASTAANADLPLFIEITQSVAPLTSLSFLFGAHESAREAEMQDMRDQADATALAPTRPEVVGDFNVLARAYEDLVSEVGALKDEWEYLQQHSGILIWQVIALCMVSFAAPFRLGKSITELRHSM